MANRTADDLPDRPAAVPPFGLAPWSVQPSLNRLIGPQRTETLEPRMMHVLVCLAAFPGEVLSRPLLLEAVWRNQVVGEETLTRVVSRLRDLLGDDSRQPRYIETIRGGGYRLVAVPGPYPDCGKRPPSAGPAARRGYRFLGAGSLLATALVLLAVAVGMRYCGRQDQPTPALLSPRPFTTLPGTEGQPDFSPDGRTVVFVWNSRTAEPAGLFLKTQDTSVPRRLTRTEGIDYHPAFSPDGQTVAFVRNAHGERALHTVPLLGGGTTRLVPLESAVFGLSWTPDGTGIVYGGPVGTTALSVLLRLDLATLEVSELTRPDPGTHTGDSWPRYSPDGKTLVFARCDHAGLRDLWRVPAAGGIGEQVTFGLTDIGGMAWLPSGNSLIVAASPAGERGLWRIDLADPAPRLLPLSTRFIPLQPAVSPDGSTLIYRGLDLDFDLQMLFLDEADADAHPTPFAQSTRNETSPVWAPDGRRIAFVSNRSGTDELWTATVDGSDLLQLTAFEGPRLSDPAWSPDGHRLALTLTGTESSWIELVDAGNGRSRRYFWAGRHARVCSWLPDGSGLMLFLDSDTLWRLHEFRPEGDSLRPRDLTLPGHPRFLPAADGIWYQASDGTGIWRLADAGTTELVVPADAHVGWRAWFPVNGVVYAIARADEGEMFLATYDPTDNSTRRLADLPASVRNLSVAPNGQAVVFTELASMEADLLSVDLSRP